MTGLYLLPELQELWSYQVCNIGNEYSRCGLTLGVTGTKAGQYGSFSPGESSNCRCFGALVFGPTFTHARVDADEEDLSLILLVEGR